MKILAAIALACTLAIPVAAAANCVNDQHGRVACGMGQCETDDHGNVYCSGAGGGAIRDMYGKVLCGVGDCAKDGMGQVRCSKVQGGGAAIDSHGRVKCLGGCDAGSSELCQEGQY